MTDVPHICHNAHEKSLALIILNLISTSYFPFTALI